MTEERHYGADDDGDDDDDAGDDNGDDADDDVAGADGDDDDDNSDDDDGDEDGDDGKGDMEEAGVERKAVKRKVGAGGEEGVKKIRVEGGGEGSGAGRSGNLGVVGSGHLGAGGSGGMVQEEHNLRDGVLAGLKEIRGYS